MFFWNKYRIKWGRRILFIIAATMVYSVLFASIPCTVFSQEPPPGVQLVESFYRWSAMSEVEGVRVVATLLTDEVMDAWSAFQEDAEKAATIDSMSNIMDHEQKAVVFITVIPGYPYEVSFAPADRNIRFTSLDNDGVPLQSEQYTGVLGEVLRGGDSSTDVTPWYYGAVVYDRALISPVFRTLTMDGVVRRYRGDWAEVRREHTVSLEFSFMPSGTSEMNRPSRNLFTLETIRNYLNSTLDLFPPLKEPEDEATEQEGG